MATRFSTTCEDTVKETCFKYQIIIQINKPPILMKSSRHFYGNLT